MTFCGYFDRGECRSCTRIEIAYGSQLRAKEARLREALAELSPPALEPTVTSAVGGFRNRAKMVVTGTSASPRIGLAGVTALDHGREILACPIHHPRLNEVVAGLPEFIREFDLEPYRIAERRGELKGVILFHSDESDETYLRFVLRSRECVSRIRKLLPKLVARFPSLAVVTANIQPIPHAILEGPDEIFITERKTLDHRMGSVRFRLAPDAFVQTNSSVAARLYARAAEWIREAKAERVLELFSGQGAFSFFAAASARAFLGIDLDPDGVAAANRAAAEQGLAHLRFIAADAAKVGDEITAFGPDLLLVNPPRRGLGDARGLVRAASPANLLYSSCSVESLARDLLDLPGYRIRRLGIFDLFPHTDHFETLAWLERTG